VFLVILQITIQHPVDLTPDLLKVVISTLRNIFRHITSQGLIIEDGSNETTIADGVLTVVARVEVSAVFEVRVELVVVTRASNKIRLGFSGAGETVNSLLVFDTSSPDSRGLPITDSSVWVEDSTDEAGLGYRYTMGAFIVLVTNSGVLMPKQTILAQANTGWLCRLCWSITWYKEGELASLQGSVLSVIKH